MAFLKQSKSLHIKENPFWQFSLQTFEKSSNRTALLHLQDKHDLNINLILALLWYANSGRGICSTDALKNLLSLIEPWQKKITEKLRELRNKISKENKELYQFALATELYSEKIQQTIIYDFFIGSFTKPRNALKQSSDAIQNLQSYFEMCKVHLTDECYPHIRVLLSNVFTAFNEHDFPQLSLEF